MCGRYGLTAKAENLTDAYSVDALLTEHHPRYNIAPTQTAPVLLHDGRGRRIEEFRWGLVPHWAGDPSIGGRLINARAETVHEKTSFRDAWQEGRRCLVLADGFYEWRSAKGRKGPKVPHWVRMTDGRLFGFAGLWERWGPEGRLHSFTILTTDANELVRPIHHRMPVVLDEKVWEAWVDPDVPSSAAARVLRPYPAAEMMAVPVSAHVNDPRHEGPECLAPLAEE